MASLSPFAGWANATIYFPLAVYDGSFDELGNPRPTIAELSATAILSRKEFQYRPGGNPSDDVGVDTVRFFCEGRLVNPMRYPVGLTFPLSCRVDLSGTMGTLILDAPVMVGVGQGLIQSIAGATLRGWFEFTQQVPI